MYWCLLYGGHHDDQEDRIQKKTGSSLIPQIIIVWQGKWRQEQIDSFDGYPFIEKLEYALYCLLGNPVCSSRLP